MAGNITIRTRFPQKVWRKIRPAVAAALEAANGGSVEIFEQMAVEDKRYTIDIEHPPEAKPVRRKRKVRRVR